MQAIAEYLDEMAPERTTPILQASYETNVRKFLDQRMDNREYSKKRPQYNFKAWLYSDNVLTLLCAKNQ